MFSMGSGLNNALDTKRMLVIKSTSRSCHTNTSDQIHWCKQKYSRFAADKDVSHYIYLKPYMILTVHWICTYFHYFSNKYNFITGSGLLTF